MKMVEFIFIQFYASRSATSKNETTADNEFDVSAEFAAQIGQLDGANGTRIRPILIKSGQDNRGLTRRLIYKGISL